MHIVEQHLLIVPSFVYDKDMKEKSSYSFLEEQVSNKPVQPMPDWDLRFLLIDSSESNNSTSSSSSSM